MANRDYTIIPHGKIHELQISDKEMYAFEPAFALIGDAALTMDNLVKVDARIHMLLLRDLIDQPKIWSFNIEEDLKRIGTSLAEIAEKHRP